MTKKRPPRLRLVPKDEDLSGILISDDDEAEAEARLGQLPRAKGRQYRRFDEAWAGKLLAAGRSVRAATWRLASVLLAEADYNWEITVGTLVEQTANLSRHEKRFALRQLESLGLIAVKRGRGSFPVVTPLLLSGRPRRKGKLPSW